MKKSLPIWKVIVSAKSRNSFEVITWNDTAKRAVLIFKYKKYETALEAGRYFAIDLGKTFKYVALVDAAFGKLYG